MTKASSFFLFFFLLNWTIIHGLRNLGKGQLPQSILQVVKVMDEADAFTFT